MSRKKNDSPEFDAYKKALAYWSAKDKFMQNQLKNLYADSFQYACSPDYRMRVKEVYEASEHPADFFITELEFRG